MANAPTLSVVLINYNHGRLLRRSLPALFAQTRPADEWILIDDASSDGSQAIMAEFARGREKVTLLCHEKNRGAVASVNHGLRHASGEYVYFAAADDVTLPALFARLLEAAAAHPGVGLCLADYFEFSDESGEVRRRHVCLNNPKGYLNAAAFGKLLLSGSRFNYPPCGIIVRRATLVELGAFDPRAEWFVDWWFNLQVGLLHGACFVPEALAGFRVNPDGFSGAGTRVGMDAERVVGALWSLATSGESANLKPMWLGAMAAMPPDTRRLMWRRVWQRPSCWSWAPGHYWRMVGWPKLRPWLWPVVQAMLQLGPANLYPAMLRLFGATVADNVRIARGVTVERPWRLRIDGGAVLEPGVKIRARASVHIGEGAVVPRNFVVSNEDRPGIEAIVIGRQSTNLPDPSRLILKKALQPTATIG